jgi:hypothetical protein
MTVPNSQPPDVARAVAWTIGLGAGGAVSGFLSAASLFSVLTGFTLPGALFGSVLAAYLWNVGRPRSAWAVIAMLCWSLSAYWTLFAAPFVAENPWTFLALLSSDVREMQDADSRLALNVGAATAAAIVSFGFLTLIQPRVSAARIALEVAACSCIGAALARAGLAVQTSVFGPLGDDWRTPTLVIWQAGIACLLGTLCVARASRAQQFAARDSSET